MHRPNRDQHFLEEGTTFASRAGLPAAGCLPESAARSDSRKTASARDRFDVIVIGAGQAGLSVGYELAQRGLDFTILDAGDRVGDPWRARWDSLRLFTPARFNGLPGMAFPDPGDRFPTKDEMAEYLERYAEHFALPVRSAVRVTRLSQNDGEYTIETTHGSFFAGQVVVAMANYQRPKIPAFAGELRNDIVQLHSSSYRDPSQLAGGDVLLVGAGNSGAEISMELAGDHRVLLAGRGTGNMPFRIEGRAARTFLLRWMLRGLFHHVFSVANPLGRRIRSQILGRGGPLVRVQPHDLVARGVERVPRVVGTEHGLPKLEDGRVLEVANTIWCTGFHPGFEWVDLPAFGEDGRPMHCSGVSEDVPGLYFVGLHFLHSLSSGMIHGVGRDAERIARTAHARATGIPEEGARSGEVPAAGLQGGTCHDTHTPTSRGNAACPSQARQISSEALKQRR